MSTLANVVGRDLFANRPAASIAGRLFFASDTGAAYRDNGTSWDTISMTNPVIGFVIGNGTAGTNVGPMLLAPRAGSFAKCAVVIKASDGATPLTFNVKQNGVPIFTALNTIAAGAAAGDVSTFTNFTTNPLPVAQNDVFSLDIGSGLASWMFTVQLG